MEPMLALRSTALVGFVETDTYARDMVRVLYEANGKVLPPFYDSIKALIKDQGAPDAALICTPHVLHYENACACLQAGTDVLLEKPMVMNASEARRLIRVRDKTGRLLVVAFPGSLSPAVRKAKQMIADGVIGEVCSVSGSIYQNWKACTVGRWRQNPAISGGGFLFDTGSHLVNTVVDVLDEDVVSVSALLNNRGVPVEITSSVSAQTRSGIMISLCGAGDSVDCRSNIFVFGNQGVLDVDAWGGHLRLSRGTGDATAFEDVTRRKNESPWQTFLKVRAGKLENPCPAEVGLRFARLMDMIRESADTGRTITRMRRAKS
jgi:predicted dehydrogenase